MSSILTLIGRGTEPDLQPNFKITELLHNYYTSIRNIIFLSMEGLSRIK